MEYLVNICCNPNISLKSKSPVESRRWTVPHGTFTIHRSTRKLEIRLAMELLLGLVTVYGAV